MVVMVRHTNSVGSEVERNLASAEFNRIMRIQCDNLLIPFSPLFITLLMTMVIQDHILCRMMLIFRECIAGQEIRALLMSSLLSSCKSCIQILLLLASIIQCNGTMYTVI